MASVQYSGVPDSVPQSAPPDDYQHEQASPEAFGGGIAAGAESLGADVTKTAGFYGQVAADDATTKYMSRAQAILYGDPSKMAMDPDGKPVIGPNGKPLPDTGYFGLSGKDAMRARPQVATRLDDIAREEREGLSPESEFAFDQYTRRMRQSFDGDVGRHADQQQTVWAKGVNQSAANTNLALAAVSPNDSENIAMATAGLRKAYVQTAQIELGVSGVTPEVLKSIFQKADQDIALTRAKAVLTSDPAAALKILDDNKSALASSPEYDGLYERTMSRVRDADIHSVADRNLVPSALPSPQGSGTAPRAEDIATLLQKSLPGLVVTGMGRTPEKNAEVGGVSDSAHLQDRALDIRASPGLTLQQLQQNVARLGLPNAKVIYEGTGAAHSTAPHFHIQWGEGGGQTSLADYYRSNFTQIQDKTRADYSALHPNDPEGADRAASQVDTRMHVFLTQDDMRVKAEYHALDAAARTPASNGQLPTTVDQILQTHPELRDSWESLITTNPYAASSFENKLLKANAMPANTTFGTSFYDLYGKVVSGQIKNASDLSAFIDPYKGDGSRLTPEGYRELTDVLGKNGTPQGKADNAMLRNFFNAAHQQINPIQKPELGIYYPPGEEKFNQYIIKAMGEIKSEQTAGKPLAEILGEKSPVYTSRFAGHFVMSPEEQMNARFKGTVYDPALNAARIKDRALRSAKTVDDLQREYTAGHISKADRDNRARELHLWDPTGKAPAP